MVGKDQELALSGAGASGGSGVGAALRTGITDVAAAGGGLSAGTT